MNKTLLDSNLAGADTRLATQAYERLLDMIMARRLPPGTLLHERRLAELLEMSRTPLRDALVMLEGEGLLVRKGTRGLMVKAMDVGDYLDNLSIRLLLEPEATKLATPHLKKESLGALERRLQVMLRRAMKGDPPERKDVRDVDEMLHSMISEAAANPQLATIIRTLRRQTQIFDLRSLPERFETTCREHLAIVAALRKENADEAASAMRVHLTGVKQSIAAWVSRI